MDNNSLKHDNEDISNSLLSKIYLEYQQKLDSNIHLPTHLSDTLILYKEIYGEEIINEVYEQIIYHFHVIINSFDDFIDNSPIELRKNYSVLCMLIFNSLFSLFSALLESINNRKDSNISLKFNKRFNESLKKNIRIIISAPLKELNPRLLNTSEERSEIILEILKNRCQAHRFLCNLIDSLLELQVAELYPLSNLLLHYKMLEMLIRDLDPEEIEKDKKSNTFNILLYLKNNLDNTSDINQLLELLINKISMIFLTSQIFEKLNENSNLQLKKQFLKLELDAQKLVINL